MSDVHAARDAAFAAVRSHLEARESLVDSVRSGQRRAVDVVADRGELAESTRLLVVLEADPTALKVPTRRRLGELGVSEMAVIGELTPSQRAAVIAAFAGAAVATDR